MEQEQKIPAYKILKASKKPVKNDMRQIPITEESEPITLDKKVALIKAIREDLHIMSTIPGVLLSPAGTLVAELTPIAPKSGDNWVDIYRGTSSCGYGNNGLITMSVDSVRNDTKYTRLAFHFDTTIGKTYLVDFYISADKHPLSHWQLSGAINATYELPEDNLLVVFEAVSTETIILLQCLDEPYADYQVGWFTKCTLSVID
ncbi:MAG: hypothetical protein ACFE96_17195 [Candidatus Hermodarchaeota archaeon]